MSLMKKKHGDDCCFSCCSEKDLVQDKMCCDFNVSVGTASGQREIIYATNGAVSCENLVASGTVKNCSTTAPLIVEFRRGVTDSGIGTLVRVITIPPAGCVTFVVARFDTIFVARPTGEGAAPISGEICITPRYTI
ncbi:hypothetical protein LC040_03230 [Bacillus tianshenii]|nr:hypothetical protein LC040_03230 [Bacillus tianshenii]